VIDGDRRTVSDMFAEERSVQDLYGAKDSVIKRLQLVGGSGGAGEYSAH
jgi:hypothetical protein